MAPTAANNAVKNVSVSALKDAGLSSAQLALAAGVTVFAVQASLVAGKVVVANVKSLAASLRA